eukprot:TRINITY_DN39099_c0_g1_i1.p1 TRINITY_DN39099_c0_g1~~TRINITY_DN39099_c0_g1_i1.p1  ORF type:complete len:360 (+),score=79.99 TRINITY_DN39099_c0_g1_i1:33-1082(+)
MPHPGHINDPLVWRPPAWIDAQQKAACAPAHSSKSDDYMRKVSDVEACAEAARAMIGFCLKAAESIDSEHIKGLLQAADTGMKELQDRIKPLYNVDVGAPAPAPVSMPAPAPAPSQLNTSLGKADWVHDDYSRKQLAETKAQVAGEVAQLAATTQAAERLAGERRRSRHNDPDPPPPTPQQNATPVRIPALPWLDPDEVTSTHSDEFHGMIGALEQRYQRVKGDPMAPTHKPIATPKTVTPRVGARTRTPSPAKGKVRSPMVHTNQSLATPPHQNSAMHWKPTPGSGPKTFTLRFDDDDYEERKDRLPGHAVKRSSSNRCLSPQGPRCVSPQNRVSPVHRRPSPAKRWR